MQLENFCNVTKINCNLKYFHGIHRRVEKKGEKTTTLYTIIIIIITVAIGPFLNISFKNSTDLQACLNTLKIILP
jgi:hypothetical protein